MNSLLATVWTNLAACAKAVRLIFDDVVHCHYLRADNNCFIFFPVAQLKVWAVKSPEDLSNEARFALFDEEGNLDLSTIRQMSLYQTSIMASIHVAHFFRSD